MIRSFNEIKIQGHVFDTQYLVISLGKETPTSLASACILVSIARLLYLNVVSATDVKFLDSMVLPKLQNCVFNVTSEISELIEKFLWSHKITLRCTYIYISDITMVSQVPRRFSLRSKSFISHDSICLAALISYV